MSTRREREEIGERRAKWKIAIFVIIVVLIVSFSAYLRDKQPVLRTKENHPGSGQILADVEAGRMTKEQGDIELAGLRHLWCQVQEDRGGVGVDPAAAWVVLLDVTDRYSDLQQEWVVSSSDTEAEFNLLMNTIEDGALLELFILGNNSELLKPMASRCNPGGWDPNSKLGPLISNPDMIRQTWRTGFLNPLIAALNKAFAPDQGPSMQSPILEQLQAAAVTALKPFTGVPRRLIVVSDFMHNTPELDHYESVQNFASFASNNSAYYNTIWVDMSGVEVQMWYKPRADPPSWWNTQRHIQFWKDYFQDMGATLGIGKLGVSDVKRIPG